METHQLSHHMIQAVWSEVLGLSEDQARRELPRKEQIEIEVACEYFLTLVFDLQAPDLKRGRARRSLRHRWFRGHR